jgi:UDP-hydrolysing UDP-N-acetyl-D-glucosamine 2-epimerase
MRKTLSTDSPRKVCVVLVDRANYGRLKPVMHAIALHPGLRLQVLAAGTMVLERFSLPVDVVREDGFPVHGEVYVELEGSTPVTMAKSVGLGLVEFSSEFRRLKPDVLLVIGDRYEALAAVIAAAYMNICVLHVQGGEVSGSIDESARHAISKFSHYHFPSTHRAARYLIRMGEHPDTVLGVGCPGSDIAKCLDRTLASDVINGTGSGAFIDTDQPYLLVVFHPTTTEYGGERRQMDSLLETLRRVKKQTVLLWPNIDAGADHVSKAIRRFRDLRNPDWLRTLINLSPDDYLKVLANAACAVGNSSSFVRDASFLGTPVVLVGNRQEGREIGAHVLQSPPLVESLEAAIQTQLQHGHYPPSTLYGDGQVAERIADALVSLTPYVQKRLYYVEEDVPSGGGGTAAWPVTGIKASFADGDHRRAVVGKTACASSE